MRVSALALEDFRSYAQVELPLARGATTFVGPNGAGKTNLLEAIHLIARGDSPRARDDTEMVRWGATVAGLLILGSIPLFVGLAFVLPWLGYSTWHLYTRLVDREAIARRCG